MTIDNNRRVGFFSPFSESDIFRFGTRRADDEIVTREIKLSEGKRAEYSDKFVFAVQKRDFLYETRKYPMSSEHRMIHMADARVNVCIGKHLEEMGYDEFRSGEVDEPIDNDRHFLCRHENRKRVISRKYMESREKVEKLLLHFTGFLVHCSS